METMARARRAAVDKGELDVDRMMSDRTATARNRTVVAKENSDVPLH